MSQIPICKPLYQQDGQLTTTTTTITSIRPVGDAPEHIQHLFKEPPADSHVITTAATVFHAQGGGQPTDTGTIVSNNDDDNPTSFEVTFVRQEAPSENAQIYHLGQYTSASSSTSTTAINTKSPVSTTPFQPSHPVTLTINASQRHYYSRLHTAGHLLGLAARTYLESLPDTPSPFPAAPTGGFTLPPNHTPPSYLIDGKASHFPSMSNVEFIGPTILATHKAGIQAKLDELIALDLPVNITFCSEHELREPGRKMYFVPEQFPIKSVDEGGSGKLRCVEVEGWGGYPCGGTHVRTTSEVGKVVVRKIGKVGKAGSGVTKISYEVEK